MNRIILLATFICSIFCFTTVNAQVDVTASGGTASASYSTLALAFTEINNGTHTGTITIGISANTTETATATLNASGSGATNYTSITISPTGGASRTISGAITAGSPLIDLSGADNVTFDGLNSGGNALTISNTTASTTSGTSTIRFIGGATNNTLTKCTIEGSFNGTLATNGGNVFFSTDGTTTNGNDNNTISYCNITAAGSNLPSKGIFMNGSTTTAAIANSGNSFLYNNIYDFFLTSGSAGVYATTGNSDLTVRFNKFYQTGTRTYTATGTMYGVYFSNTTYGNNINISDNTIGYASSSATGTLTLTGSGFAGAFQGIYVAIMTTSSTAYLNRNTVSDISLTSSSGVLYGIVNASGASSNTIYIDTNTVSNLTLTTSTGAFYGISWASATNMYIRGNTINNLSRNTAGITYGMYSGSSSTNEYVNYNTVSNLTNTAASATTITMRGIYQLTATGIKEFTNNTVHSLSIPNSTATGCTLEGMRVNYGVTVSISGNNIYNLTGVANTLAGFATAGTTGSATYTISKNKIYGLQSTRNSATAGFCTGILISGGTSNTYDVFNNLIGDITATIASNTDAIRGLSFTLTSTSSTLNVYYNTIYLSASSTGTDFGTTGIYHAANATATTAALTLRNNIIYNNSTAAGTGLVVAYRRSAGGAGVLANYTSTSNNNLFYAGTPSSTNLIYSDGTSTAQTMSAYKSGTFTAGNISPRETASVTESMTFQSTTGSSANFLKYDLTVPTQAESGAAVISGYSTDFTGTTRSGSTPDMGAWELSGTAADLSGPNISYTNISNTSSTSNRTTTSFATITDATGVNTSTGTRPRIYYKKSSDNNAFAGNTSGDNGWKWVQANGTSSPFDFTIDYSIINGGSVTTGDVIQYFVVAQDVVSTPNVNANPSTGFSGTSVSSISAAPTTPNSYIITSAPLSGSYNVGTSGAYTTITAAVTDLNLRGVSGAVTFNLTDASYSGSETFPIVISEIAGASSTNTITLKPASSNTVTITGSSSTSILSLNGADYIIIDGSNSGSSTRDLTIANTSTATTSGVIWLSSASASNGATYNTVKNSIITGNANTTTYAGIFMGGNTSIAIASLAQTSNKHNAFTNNQVSNSIHGIITNGTSSSVLDSGLVVSNNNIGTSSNALAGVGLAVYFATSPQIYGNTIQNISGSSSLSGIAGSASILTGMYIRNCNSAIVYNNILFNIGSGTGSSRKSGICTESPSFNSVSTPSNNQFYNNLLYHICNGATGNTSWGVSGITACGGYGDKFYFNTIQLSHPSSANVNNANGPFAGFANGNAIQTVATSNLEFKNNVVILTGVTAATSTSYLHYAHSTATYTGANISNNRYYANLTGNSTNNVGIYGGTSQTTLTGWQSAFSGENGTTLGDPSLNSITNLRPQPGSPLLATGTPISGITTDILAVTRNTSTPTIGAYETAVDLVGPAITYTALSNTSFNSNRTTSSFATITDGASGVNTTSGTRPRLYYKKSTDNNAFVGNTSGDNGWKWVQANGTTSPFDFTIDYSIINGGSVTTSDVIQYFVVAQDLASTPNITASPSSGFSGTLVSSISSAPTTPNSYTIVAGLGTSINVGTGQTYTTLTGSGGLFAAINGAALTGNTTVTIVSDLSEDGTNALMGAGLAGYTLNIVPDGTTPRVISNSTTLSQAMIRLNGVTGVTFDGRFSGSGQYLRVVNTHTTPGSCTAAIEVLNSSTNTLIRNCIIETNSTSTATGVVHIGSGTNTGITLNTNDIRDAQGTPGTSGIPANLVYSNTSTNVITVQNNNLYNFTAYAINFTSVGSGCTISGNSVYYNSGTTPSTSQVGIYLAAGNNHSITGNYVGGQSASCGGSAWSNSGAITFSGISLNVGTTTASSVQNNTVQNINLTGTAGVNFNGILISGGSVNVGTTTGNTIGHSSTSNSVQNSGSSATSVTAGINNTSAGAVNISNNTIANLTATGTTTSVGLRGISHTGSGQPTISSNTISSLTSSSATTSTTTAACLGIYSSSANTAQVIENNIIHTLENVHTTAGNYTNGISITSSSSTGTIKRNRIYNLKNLSSAGLINGLYFNFGTWTVVNNQIVLTNGSNTNSATIRGIHDNSGNTISYYYNSVYVGGSISSGAVNSYAFYRGTSTTTVTLRNNIFFNERSGGTGAHYAIGNLGSTLTTGWSSTACNYNLYVCPSLSAMGEWGTTTAQTLAQWQTSSSGDASSQVELSTNLSAANLFTSLSAGNMNVQNSNVECWYLNGRGTQVSGQTEDYGSTSAGRSTTVTAGGTDIGSDEFTPGVNPPDVTVSGSHTNSGTETFTFAGRTVASITWGASGTLPTLSSYKYWPGTWPNDPTNNGGNPTAKYAHAYWVINTTGGSGYTYDITLNYDDALLGTIASESNVRLAKKQTGVNGTWANYSTSTPNTTANTLTMTGLNSFSEFTLTDNVDPLPVEWLSFTGKKVFDNVELSWITATEINNSHFEVERSTDGRNFEHVGEVKGAGNSFTPLNYNYADVAPFGTNSMLYYRLKQVDFNGEYEFSKTIAVSNNKQGNGVTIEAINPNPFTEKLNLTLTNVSEGNVTIEVYDLSGRKHYTQTTLSSGQGTLSIDLSSLANLAKGVYIVNIRNGNEAIQQKLVKLK